MTIKDLIIDFQTTAKKVADQFYEKYNTKKLLLACHSNEIPRNGSFGIIKKYYFHGCGLQAKLNGSEIDFDFGENDRVDGFDAWRLGIFAKSKPQIYSQFLTENLIQTELDKLEKNKLIYKPNTFPGSSNYYWT